MCEYYPTSSCRADSYTNIWLDLHILETLAVLYMNKAEFGVWGSICILILFYRCWSLPFPEPHHPCDDLHNEGNDCQENDDCKIGSSPLWVSMQVMEALKQVDDDEDDCRLSKLCGVRCSTTLWSFLGFKQSQTTADGKSIQQVKNDEFAAG